MYRSYAEGDDLRSEQPDLAISLFEKVVDLETQRGDQVKWFVCLNHSVS